MAFAARGIALLLVLVSVALIVAATTMPWSMYYVGHSHWAHVEWVPFSRTVRPDDFLLNILLFLPFGFSAYVCGVAGREQMSSSRDASSGGSSGSSGRRRLQGVVLAAILLSVGVELFQVYCHGRLPTTSDVISNALGAYLGARWAAARFTGR